MPGRIAYVTDVEGRWEKLAAFCADNPIVRLDDRDRLHVSPGGTFVFGGDAVDRGPGGRRVLSALVDAKRRAPDRVVLLSGNRDLNKLRLSVELTGRPPSETPPDVAAGPRPELLRWILSRTMGARDAFEHRRAELAATEDDAIVASFVEDVAAGGLVRAYLELSQLAWRSSATLFVHGAVTAESLGVVPTDRGEPGARVADVDGWIAALNAFHARQIAAFVADPTGDPDVVGWGGVVRYQAPVPGTNLNQSSVVYGRPADANNHPVLPGASVIEQLERAGVRRVVVGHTPSGDCPTIVRDGAGFELVMADNSYGRIETGSLLVLDDDLLQVRGAAELDDGRRVDVRFELEREDLASPIGRELGAKGRLVKATLESGQLLTFRGLPGRRIEQLAVDLDDLSREN